ncbi:hypothetical protein B0H17DRAFT_1149644 [Mycena rosella]|uniref:Uncharacterized protein n=1 Tax=Mycena rosella TaxID=1033263 RepID=A0AAD7FPC1_MYCRO|nr:hypothetical protein B0H17DRAFT_1149644 [Mycena rosella]
MVLDLRRPRPGRSSAASSASGGAARARDVARAVAARERAVLRRGAGGEKECGVIGLLVNGVVAVLGELRVRAAAIRAVWRDVGRSRVRGQRAPGASGRVVCLWRVFLGLLAAKRSRGEEAGWTRYEDEGKMTGAKPPRGLKSRYHTHASTNVKDSQLRKAITSPVLENV